MGQKVTVIYQGVAVSGTAAVADASLWRITYRDGEGSPVIWLSLALAALALVTAGLTSRVIALERRAGVKPSYHPSPGLEAVAKRAKPRRQRLPPSASDIAHARPETGDSG